MNDNLIYKFGNWSPLILIGTSVYLLRNKSNFLYYYIIGQVLNAILNVCLKITIQYPRPNIDKNAFKIALTNFNSNIFKDGIPDIFGMPSGHTQSVVFSTVYVFLTLKNKRILFIYLFISFITMWQRVNYNFHTIYQVVIGFIVGSVFAYFMFLYGRQKISGVIKQKSDDFAIF